MIWPSLKIRYTSKKKNLWNLKKTEVWISRFNICEWELVHNFDENKTAIISIQILGRSAPSHNVKWRPSIKLRPSDLQLGSNLVANNHLRCLFSYQSLYLIPIDLYGRGMNCRRPTIYLVCLLSYRGLYLKSIDFTAQYQLLWACVNMLQFRDTSYQSPFIVYSG